MECVLFRHRAHEAVPSRGRTYGDWETGVGQCWEAVRPAHNPLSWVTSGSEGDERVGSNLQHFRGAVSKYMS